MDENIRKAAETAGMLVAKELSTNLPYKVVVPEDQLTAFWQAAQLAAQPKWLPSDMSSLVIEIAKRQGLMEVNEVWTDGDEGECVEYLPIPIYTFARCLIAECISVGMQSNRPTGYLLCAEEIKEKFK